MKTLISFILGILLSFVIFYLGYYAGKQDGIAQGITQYQNCVWNGATGWYVENADLRCIF